jgi:hypothetical protein
MAILKRTLVAFSAFSLLAAWACSSSQPDAPSNPAALPQAPSAHDLLAPAPLPRNARPCPPKVQCPKEYPEQSRYPITCVRSQKPGGARVDFSGSTMLQYTFNGAPAGCDIRCLGQLECVFSSRASGPDVRACPRSEMGFRGLWDNCKAVYVQGFYGNNPQGVLKNGPVACPASAEQWCKDNTLNAHDQCVGMPPPTPANVPGTGVCCGDPLPAAGGGGGGGEISCNGATTDDAADDEAGSACDGGAGADQTGDDDGGGDAGDDSVVSCGDGDCELDEDCATCPLDCGQCIDDDGGIFDPSTLYPDDGLNVYCIDSDDSDGGAGDDQDASSSLGDSGPPP